MDPTLGAKVIVMFLLAAIKVISGILPLGLKRLLNKGGMEWVQKIMAAIMCFGGGVLLATVFMHMLPEVRDEIELARRAAGKDPYRTGGFSFAELVVCSGFFLVYLTEGVVQKIFKLKHNHSHGLPITKEEISLHDSDNRESQDEDPESSGKAPVVSKEKRILSSLRSLIIVLALSIHSIFEGLAIGLQTTSTDVWMLFLAVVIHEAAILFCVGNEMANNGMKTSRIVFYIVTLGVITPIGIITGLVLTLNTQQQVGTSESLVIAVLQGMAAGTLLYMTFFEVLEREKLEKIGMSGILGCLTIVGGFVFMTVMTYVGEHLEQTNTNSSLSDANGASLWSLT